MQIKISNAILISLFGSSLFINLIDANEFKKKLFLKGVSAGLLLNSLIMPSKAIIPLPMPGKYQFTHHIKQRKNV
jgi:hypothetical protein